MESALEFTTVKSRIQFFDELSTKKRRLLGSPLKKNKNVSSTEFNGIINNIESELKVIEFQIQEYSVYEKELHQVLQLKLFDILIKLVRFNDKSRKFWKQEVGGNIHNLFKILHQRLPSKNLQGYVISQKRAIFEKLESPESNNNKDKELLLTTLNTASKDEPLKTKLFLKNTQQSPFKSIMDSPEKVRSNSFPWSVSQLKSRFEGTESNKDIALTESNLSNWRAKQSLTGKYLGRGGVFHKYNGGRSKSESCLMEEQEFD